jgi:hypothetical protein
LNSNIIWNKKSKKKKRKLAYTSRKSWNISRTFAD